ncbi:MAG: response regulator [Magnetococcus sp. YQC-9]
MAIDLKKFILRFVEEARDHLRQLNEGLSSLESGDGAVVHAIFRSAHTIKGSARMLKLDPITETAHRIEDILGVLRDGKGGFHPEMGEWLHRALEEISAQVDRLAETPDAAKLTPVDPALLANLIRLAVANSPPVPAADVTAAAPPASPVAAPSPIAASSASAPAVSAEPIVPSNATQPEARLKSSDTVRVRLTKLDELIKLMGELLSSHTRMRQRLIEVVELERQSVHAVDREEFGAALHRFALRLREDAHDQEGLMNELHDKTLMMRMLPLAVIFEPAQGLVRDLARSVGKQVICQVKGGEIELDRRIIDKLSDPVIHLLRNAIDHGLESPQARRASGKPEQGRLTLSARHESGQVVIEIEDDGAGIAFDKVRAKAIRMGVINEERAATLTEREILDLIFLPGFSTANFVTDLSGRGVGMDVVRQSVQDELRGAIDLETRVGLGTTLRLRVPFSLALVRVLLVEVAGRVFGFTARHVSLLKRVPRTATLEVGERSMVILGNEFVPLLRLNELLELPDLPGKSFMSNGPIDPGERFGMLLVVLLVRDEKIALEVDALLDEHDMVLHPVPEMMKTVSLLSGLVVTGENALVSVLHAPALFERARRVRVLKEKIVFQKSTVTHDRVLVVDDSLNTREIEKDLLEACGFSVTLAEDGLDGLRHALASEFDAVLTDVEMPGMDGFSLTERLRREERYRDKPIIILTSRDREEDKQRGMRAGADAYIVKGDFSQGNLVDTLRNLLGWRGHA